MKQYRLIAKKPKDKLVILGILLIVNFGCSNIEKSPVEILKLDNQIIAEIINPNNSDSVSIEYPKRNEFWSIEHYFIKPNRVNLVFRDSLNNVVGYYRRINGQNYEGAEYYSNGQIVGKLNYSKPGVFDGEAKYYYEDGRLRSIGNWQGFNQIGIWKNYKESGELESIEEYNEKGELIKKEKTNR